LGVAREAGKKGRSAELMSSGGFCTWKRKKPGGHPEAGPSALLLPPLSFPEGRGERGGMGSSSLIQISALLRP